VNPALWADITRDLDAATRYAETAVQRAASLESHSEDMDDDIREDRQAAIGLLLHLLWRHGSTPPVGAAL
jgi:hypothetical protein